MIKGRSRVLYYKVLMENFQKLCGIVYTPTIGLVCQRWSQPIFKSGLHKEMYLSMEDKGEMAALIYNYPYNDVDLVIVTDGSRVLGLGDLGVNGAGIIIGKADLYIAGAGFDPSRSSPSPWTSARITRSSAIAMVTWVCRWRSRPGRSTTSSSMSSSRRFGSAIRRRLFTSRTSLLRWRASSSVATARRSSSSMMTSKARQRSLSLASSLTRGRLGNAS